MRPLIAAVILLTAAKSARADLLETGDAVVVGTMTAGDAVVIGTMTASVVNFSADGDTSATASYSMGQLDLTTWDGAGALPLVLGAPNATAGAGVNGLSLYTMGISSTAIGTNKGGQFDIYGCDPVIDPVDCAVNLSGGLWTILFAGHSGGGHSVVDSLIYNQPGVQGIYSFDDYDAPSSNYYSIVQFSTNGFYFNGSGNAFTQLDENGGLFIGNTALSVGPYPVQIEIQDTGASTIPWDLSADSSGNMHIVAHNTNNGIQLEDGTLGMNLGVDHVTIATTTFVTGDVSVSGQVHAGLNTQSTNCSSATSCSISCSGLAQALGGGCNGSGAPVSATYPSNSNTWSCSTTASTTITVYVICANVTN